MRYDLRPRSFVEILDLSFRLLRDHFVAVAGVMVAFHLPYECLSWLLTPTPELGAEPGLASGLTSLGIHFALAGIVLPIGELAATHMIVDAQLGRSSGISDALRHGARLYAGRAGTFFLMQVVLFGAFLVLVIPWAYLMVRWMLFVPVVVMEQRFGRAALQRSDELVRGSRWSAAGLLATAVLMVFLVSSGLEMAIGSVPLLGPVLVAVVRGIGSAYTTVVVAVVYFDLRCRKEDFDLTVLAQQVGRASALQEQPVAPI